MSEWQPIETAPKDGSSVLLWSEAWDMSWGVVIGSYDAGAWVTSEGQTADDDEDEFGSIAPTHWMPLPPPPSPATQERE